MAELKTLVNEVKDFIKDTCILTHFGGLCYLKNDGSITYGISTEEDTNGKLYGNNHNELSGFLHISRMGNTVINNQVNKTYAQVDLHVFVPHKLIGEYQKYYYVSNVLFSKLQQKFWKKYSISYNGSVINKYPDVEYSIISIEIPYFTGCEDLELSLNSIC